MLVAGVSCAALKGGPQMTSIYIDSVKGDDANSGTSPDSPWKTLSRLGSAPLSSHTRILLAGGQVFEGTVAIRGKDGEPSGIEITSYGEGRAEIRAGAGDGVLAEGVSNVKITNLKLVGAGRKEGSDQGRGVHLRQVKGAVVDHVEASGFQRAGIEPRDSEDVRITNFYAHENGHAGISAVTTTKLYIGYCRTINNPGDHTIKHNHSGNGIVVSGCADVVVEYCESAENGWDQFVGGQGNGPVGIWCHDSERVIIQHCVAHHNKSTSGDGGAFDFDGGTSDSILQYNYSYENQSSGMLLWEYGSKKHLTRNTIRYNIFVHDGEAGIRFGKSGGFDVTDIETYHNLVISKGVPCVMGQSGGVSNVNIRNNIFIGPSGGVVLKDHGGVRYEGNCYWSSDGTFSVDGHSTLKAWASATGQEMVAGKLAGLFADPQLASQAGTVIKITDLGTRSPLKAYTLLPQSPLIDRGLDLKTLFAIDPGSRDFFGNVLPGGSGLDIGAHERGSSPGK